VLKISAKLTDLINSGITKISFTIFLQKLKKLEAEGKQQLTIGSLNNNYKK